MTNTPGIYRGQLSFEQGFTRIPNSWLRDNRIGFRAKGLLAYLLSHEVGYTITLGQMARESNDGRHAIRSAIDELVKAGYLRTKRTHDERGWNAGLAWFLQDPHPKSENPTLENPTLENRPALEENLKEKTTKEEVNPQAELEEAFNKFWALYPRKVEKIAAKKAFIKAAKQHGTATLLEGAQRLASDPNLPAKQFIPYPASWLNAGGWTNEPYPERIKSKEEIALEERRLAEHRRAIAQRKHDELMAEAKRAREEAEANPPQLCEHNRVAVICQKCQRAKLG